MNHIENTLNGIGVHVKWFGLKYKSLRRILKEMSNKWNYLDEDTHNKISKLIAGER